MAVLYKSDTKKALEELDRYYEELKAKVQGKDLDEDEARHLVGPDRYDLMNKASLVSISPDGIEDAIEHLKATFLALKRLKTRAIKGTY